ncbi:MAG: hypothetical protein COB65_01210 [Thalassobium sp.]|nr:MAG: hypothetical protein COB65_01210 [Thalassobium sp.]
MTIKHLISFVLGGKPILREYSVMLSEHECRKRAKRKFNSDDDLTHFSFSNDALVGHFSGTFSRRQEIRRNATGRHSKSKNDALFIEGEIHPIKENELRVGLLFHRAKFTKWMIWISFLLMAVVWAYLWVDYITTEDFTSFTMLSSLFTGVFVLFVLLQIKETTGAINSFERHFFHDYSETEFERR